MADKYDERQRKVEALREELEADAVLVLVLRDPDDEVQRPQSLIGSSDPDSLSAKLVAPLGRKIAGMIQQAFEGAGAVVDFVDRRRP